MDFSQSEGSLDAFLNADNDEEESLHLKKPSKGGGGTPYGRGYGGESSHRSSYGGGSGSNYGMGSYAAGGRGAFGGAGYDPLANIDLGNIPPPAPKSEKRASASTSATDRRKQDLRSSAPAASGARGGDSTPMQRAQQQRAGSRSVGRGEPDRSQERGVRTTSGSREPSKPASAAGRGRVQVQVSDSEEEEEEPSKPDEEESKDAGVEGESEFARMIREMQQLSESADLLRKQQEEEAEEAKRREEQERKDAEEAAKLEAERVKKEAEERAKKEEEDRKKRLEEDKRRKEEEEKKRKEDIERKKKEEEERKKKEEEEKIKREKEYEEQKRQAEEAKKKADEEAQKAREEEQERLKAAEEEYKRKEAERAEWEKKEKERKEDEARRASMTEEEIKEERAAKMRKMLEEEREKREAAERAQAEAEEKERQEKERERLEEERKVEEERRKKEEEERAVAEEAARKAAAEAGRKRQEAEEEERKALMLQQAAAAARAPSASPAHSPGAGSSQAPHFHMPSPSREPSMSPRQDIGEAAPPPRPPSASPQASAQPSPRLPSAFAEGTADSLTLMASVQDFAAFQGKVQDQRPASRLSERPERSPTASGLGAFSGASPRTDASGLLSPQAQLQPQPQPQQHQAAFAGLMTATSQGLGTMGDAAAAGLAAQSLGQDASWLMLRSTDSAEAEQRRRFWQLQAQQLQQEQGQRQGGPTAAVARDGGLGTPGFDVTDTSLLMGSTVLSDVGQLGQSRPFSTMRPEDLQASLPGSGHFQAAPGVLSAKALRQSLTPQVDVLQRVDRVKLEALRAEIQGLHKKIKLLEEFNEELVVAKTQAEGKAAQADEQIMLLKLENRKLQDGTSTYAAALREAQVLKHDLEAQLELVKTSITDEVVSAESAATRAMQERAEMLECIEALRHETEGLKEERDTLREDLANIPSAAAIRLGRRGQAAAEAAAAAAEDAVEDMAVLKHLGIRGGDEDEDKLAKARLEAELEMTEKLLKGCEKENETLAQQNRQLRQASRLKKEEVEGHQLKLVSELNAAKASADANPASMRRVTELERELVVTKERADEHARDLERCREARRQLERELITGGTAAPVEEDKKRQLADALDRCGRAEEIVEEMRERLRLYAESQREMDEDRKEVARLAEDMHALRLENAELKRRPGAKEAGRRNAELRKQVDELQECLRKRNPDSILALIKACEPKPEDRKELRDLQGRVAELEGKLAEREMLYDRQVRAMRAQYDHIRHEYEKRQTGAPSGLNGSILGAADDRSFTAAPDREAVLQARIKDLERQVEQTKSYYLTKLRKREPLVPPTPTRSAPRSASAASSREAELQRLLRERDARIEELGKALHVQMAVAAERGGGNLGSPRMASARYPPLDGTAPTLASASMLRLFLASPEAPPLVALSLELRSMARAAAARKFSEVASQGRALLSVLCAGEAAAGAFSATMPSQATLANEPMAMGGVHDVLRLRAQPPLPCAVWSAWRRQTELLTEAAAEASLRSEAAVPGSAAATAIAREVIASLAALRNCVDSVLLALLRPAGMALTASTAAAAAAEAWGVTSFGALESLLPRLTLERVQEDLQVGSAGERGGATAATCSPAGLLQDAEVHSGLDHRLPWNELAGVLDRCGIAGPKLLGECRHAANSAWSFPISDLRAFLAEPSSPSAPAEAPCGSLTRALARIRLVANRNEPPLPQVFRKLDIEGRGYVPRAEFVEVLRGLRCLLTAEERSQLTGYFTPAGDPSWVCYPLFLHSVTPLRGEAGFSAPAGPDTAALPQAADAAGFRHHDAWSLEGSRHVQQLRFDGHGAKEMSGAALARLADLEAENLSLRERNRALTTRCSEQAALVAQSPAQMVTRLQGEVAALEAEITLRAELDVSRHEVTQLRRQLGMKDREVAKYQGELDGIILELADMRATSLVR
eukprot:TRINITY_DN24827_c0_g1_i1.p1 TRINITY_DN24827_c0_g1~~TRINITY_DN24827_c0_g1_i1.p1  ORF type:complete len:1923 (+),score=632.60 TRINITY_DN24827_c0_g1_i1:285-6053(+)